MTKKKWLLIGIGALLVVCVLCGIIVGTSDSEETKVEEVVAEKVIVEDVAIEETVIEELEDSDIIRPGTYIIGTDLFPGIYKGEAGTDFFDSCYWARLGDLSGELGSINANSNSIGQFYFQVLSTDYAIETDCVIKPFSKPNIAPTDFPNELFPGVYIVGIDMKFGTYRGLASEDILESCYWSRLSDLTYGLGSIIANDNAVGQYYIEVSENDYALETTCVLELIE